MKSLLALMKPREIAIPKYAAHKKDMPRISLGIIQLIMRPWASVPPRWHLNSLWGICQPLFYTDSFWHLHYVWVWVVFVLFISICIYVWKQVVYRYKHAITQKIPMCFLHNGNKSESEIDYVRCACVRAYIHTHTYIHVCVNVCKYMYIYLCVF